VRRFGGTVPALQIQLLNADTGATLITDTTTAHASGTWNKSIDGGSNWIVYDTDDVTNDITYIKYTPSSPLSSGVMVKAVLTQV
jgi:hypothetical protein